MCLSCFSAHHRILYIWVFVLAISMQGCGAMANNRGWGQDATLTPGWKRVANSARSAATAPTTWVPGIAALAFRGIGHIDRNTTERASTRTPLFGSRRDAEQMSDDLLTAADVVWALSAAATPSGDDYTEWVVNKSKGIGVQAGGGILLRRTVGYIKDATDHNAPNGIDKDGYPSGHVTMAAYFSTLASRNMETLGWSSTAATATNMGLGALTALAGWARIEANQHFPSDVLGSVALGHFFAAFVNDAFIGTDRMRNVALMFEPRREGAIVIVRCNF